MNKHIRAFLPALLVAGIALGQDGGDEAKQPDFPAWDKVGKEMEGKEGFWNVYQDKKKRNFWIEITALDQPFLLATSISGGTTLAGHMWNDWFLVWQRNDKRLVLLERNVGFKAVKEKEVKSAVERTYTDRVVATFPIKTMGPKGGVVIDGANFFADNASLFFGGVGRSRDASLASFAAKPFPDNTEVSVTMPSAGSGTLITLHYSVSRLKQTDYKPRLADDRIGYFMTVLKDFSVENKEDNRNLRYVNRWNLQKLDPKLALSPPREPITFYIEKTVPVRLRRYVRDGILEWNRAFEKIGFDNAIVVLQQEENNEHADKDPEDVRYNFFRWIYSETPFAMGPSRVNPLTGEILDADIIMDDSYIRYTLQEYRMSIRQVPVALTGVRGREMMKKHPLMRLMLEPAQDEFLDAIPEDAARPGLRPHGRRAFCGHGAGFQHQLATCGLLMAEAAGEGDAAMKEFPEELIGQFVKDTVMHEVGHTLGLRHNFKASIYRSYDEINSESKPGDITGSVMDYNPVIIAPEGRPQGNWAMRTIGPYDHWAIQYGYTTEDGNLPAILARVAEKGLDYATDEDTWSDDPFIARWDMGSDPLAYAIERIALMKRLRKNLEARAVDKGEGYNRLRRAMGMQLFEARNSGAIAARFVGGEHLHRDHRGDPGARPPLVPVSAAKQREALNFICDEILSGRYFAFDPEFLRKLAPDFWGDDFFAIFFNGHGYAYADNVLAVQFSLVYGLTSPDRLGRVLDAVHKTPSGQDLLTVPEIFDALEATIFKGLGELPARKGTNQAPGLTDLERNLQREYVSHLIQILLSGEGWYPASIQTLARHYVKSLSARIKGARGGATDTYTIAHLDECTAKLDRALEASFAIVR